MRAVSLPEATACLIRSGQPVYLHVTDILGKMATNDVEMDEVSHDEVEHVDGQFATVWTPYKFYENGKVGLVKDVDACCETVAHDGFSCTTLDRTTSACGRILTKAG